MKVIHLPANIASLMSHNVLAERRLGIDSRGLCREDSKRLDYTGLETVKIGGLPWRVFQKVWLFLRAVRLIFWADVVHWYGATPLYFLERLVWKPKVHTWCGAEVRMAAYEYDNPYYKPGEYDLDNAWGNLLKFWKYFPIAENPSVMQYTGGMYLGRGITPLEPTFTHNGYVIHAGSQPVTKGTPEVQKVLDRLCPGNYRIARDLPRDELLEAMRGCKIFVGQYRLGDIGMAEIEAMWLGKPVLAFVKASLRDLYGKDFPLIYSTLDTLEGDLRLLLEDDSLRRKYAYQCFVYAVKNFQSIDVATRRLDIYERITEKG